MFPPFFFSTISISVGQALDLRVGIVYCPFSSSSMVLITFGGADFLKMGVFTGGVDFS